MAELSEVFNSRMNDFQWNLKAATPAANPSSNINSQFQSFRTFVLSALESLQLQINILSRHHDKLEMRSRSKILLIHGIAEDKRDDTVAKVLKVCSEKLRLPDISHCDISCCHCIGSSNSKRTRAILVRFHETKSRDKCWSVKTCLKGTEITLSEFLTKPRHDAFVLARKHFGVTNCWTRDGHIIVLGSDGERHRVSSVSEVNNLHSACCNNTTDPPSECATVTSKDRRVVPNVRSKRLTKK